MAKVVVDWGYKQFVLDTDKAIQLAEIVQGAELYMNKYHGKTDTEPSYTTHHIFPMNNDDSIGMRILTTEAYQMYKLAGKPQD
jgi:hypothetical protein